MYLRFILFLLFAPVVSYSQVLSTDIGSDKTPSDSMNVLHYTLNLDITDIQGKIIRGNADILITPYYQKVYTLKLDLYKLSVDSIIIDSLNQLYTYNDTNIYLVFSQGLTLQDTLNLTVYYHGTPVVEPYGWGGFHFSGNTMAYNLGIALEEAPPNYGRVWYPCIDNFTERSSYDFFVRVTDPLVAVCNGTFIGSQSSGNGTTVYHWNLQENIPAYLASVAVSNYIAVKDTFNSLTGPIPTFIYVKPADSVKAVNSFINLNHCLSVFENRFGPYRWPRVGYVSTPLGAMEHATNIAYPNSSIDGTLNSETLYAHELSHMWFGNLITCHSPSDMWINEGWASFSEGIFKEGVYGTAAFRNIVRAKHHDVLKLTHHKDGGYYPLAGIPSNLTYGSTVYDKGSSVVHSMRAYLGDGLFFNSVRQLTDSFAFKDITSYQMRDFLTSVSGVNMNDFFDTWVFNAGFPHFSIDSVDISPNGPPFDVTVFIKQKSKGTLHISNSNILEIGFGRQDGHIEYDHINFSGTQGSKTFQLPFAPSWTGLDPNEKTADATTDNYRFITSPGTFNFPQTYCSVEAQQVPDTALVRVIHNWVAPDTFPQSIPGFRLSTARYWTIEGIFPPGFTAKGKFSYSKFNYLDNDLITNMLDSLVLLFRSSCAQIWQSINFTMNGLPYQGELIVDSLRKGEYALGIWDHNYLGINDKKTTELIRISPNPASHHFHIYLNSEKPLVLNIYNTNGSLIDSIACGGGDREITWVPKIPEAGLFFFQLINYNDSILVCTKAILIP